MLIPPVLALWLGSTPASATERVLEHWSEADGLPINTVHAVDQGPDGAIWLSTLVGAVRYDGHRFETMEPSGLPPARHVRFLGDRVVVLPHGRSSPLRYLGGDPFPGPDGEALYDVRAFELIDGDLWVSSHHTVYRRSRGEWELVVDTGGKVREFAVDDGRVLAVTDAGLWRVRPGPPEVVHGHLGLAALERFDDRWIGIDLGGEVVDLSTDPARILGGDHGFPESMVVRGDTLWASFDESLVSLDRHGVVREHPVPELDGVAFLLLDSEDSLWLAGSRGVVRFPEPDTVNWVAEDGLPFAPVDGIDAVGERLWLRSRSELAWIEGDRVGPLSETHKVLALCPDDAGTVWAGGVQVVPLRGVITRDPGPDEVRYPLPEGVSPGGCAQTGAGLLFNAGGVIYRVGDPPVAVGAGPPELDDDGFPQMLAAPDGRLWWHEGERWCTAPPDPVPQQDSWTCADQPFSQVVFGDGDRWARSAGGLHVWRESGWELVDVPVAGVERIAASPRGGVWLLGIGLFARWHHGEIVEQIGWQHGLVDRSPLVVHEQDDGTLWIGTRTGLSRIPASARNRELPVPSVVLAELSSDGQAVDPDALALRWDDNRLTIRVSALSYADPANLRYELVSNGRAQRSTDGTFRFLDLSPGSYDVSIRASLDGVRWSETPVRVQFSVARPPWLRWWAILGYLTAILGTAALIYRARVSYLLGLERQRARIALDLHDEVGSGLGSIGLIAGALPLLDDTDKAAETIASTSAELGEALTDIVWALKPDSERVESLLGFLEQRGNAMFADPSIAFRVVPPDPLPTTTLSLPVRRTLTAIALEAMHNTAKYAEASTVELVLQTGRPWTLIVRDDGVGIDPEAPVRPGGGTGLESMRKRADIIGATLEIDSSEAGTTVRLTFDPAASDRRIG